MPKLSRETKRAYVEQQRQTRDHTCHWTSCNRQVKPAMWGCREHWFTLPRYLRDLIWEEYRPGQEANPMLVSRGYYEVARFIQTWIRWYEIGRKKGEKEPILDKGS